MTIFTDKELYDRTVDICNKLNKAGFMYLFEELEKLETPFSGLSLCIEIFQKRFGTLAVSIDQKRRMRHE